MNIPSIRFGRLYIEDFTNSQPRHLIFASPPKKLGNPIHFKLVEKIGTPRSTTIPDKQGVSMLAYKLDVDVFDFKVKPTIKGNQVIVKAADVPKFTKFPEKITLTFQQKLRVSSSSISYVYVTDNIDGYKFFEGNTDNHAEYWKSPQLRGDGFVKRPASLPEKIPTRKFMQQVAEALKTS